MIVKDLDESVHFYRDVLGFMEGYHVGSSTMKNINTNTCRYRMSFSEKALQVILNLKRYVILQHCLF